MLRTIKDAIERLEPLQPALSFSGMALRLLVAFAILGVSSAALWLILLSGKSGWLPLSLITATGPFAGVIRGDVPELLEPCVIEAVLFAGLAVSLLGRRFGPCRIVGYLSLVLWFFFGLTLAGLRV